MIIIISGIYIVLKHIYEQSVLQSLKSTATLQLSYDLLMYHINTNLKTKERYHFGISVFLDLI